MNAAAGGGRQSYPEPQPIPSVFATVRQPEYPIAATPAYSTACSVDRIAFGGRGRDRHPLCAHHRDRTPNTELIPLRGERLRDSPNRPNVIGRATNCYTSCY